MSLPHRPSQYPIGSHPPPSSTYPTSSHASAASAYPTGSHASASSAGRHRQYAHLAAQLAQLHARLADLENLVRMTSVQAEDVRGLGGWMGGLFMASSKILGDEVLAASSGAKAAGAARRRAEAGLGGEGAEGTAAGGDVEKGDGESLDEDENEP